MFVRTRLDQSYHPPDGRMLSEKKNCVIILKNPSIQQLRLTVVPYGIVPYICEKISRSTLTINITRRMIYLKEYLVLYVICKILK